MLEPNVLTLAFLPLAVFRLTYLITSEEGPFHALETLRWWWGQRGYNFVINLDCPFCMSVWVAAFSPVLLLHPVGVYIVYVLGLSCISMLIHVIINATVWRTGYHE